MSVDTAKAVALLRDLTRRFDMAFRAATPFYPRVCTVVESDGADEKYGWLGAIPGVREWLGDRVFNELAAATYVLANKHWEDSLAIKKDDLDDDRMGMYRMAMPNLASRAAQHPDKLRFQIMVAGSTTACYDGQYFYDTDHAWGDSGTQSNLKTYDAADHTNVTVTEFKAAFQQAVNALLGFKDDRGELFRQPTVGRLNDLIVEVPLALRKVAYEAIEAVILSNSTNVKIDNYDVACSPMLTDGASFYTHFVGDNLKPFVFQARQPLKRFTKGLDDGETKDAKFMTDARYNVGYLAWWNTVKTTFN